MTAEKLQKIKEDLRKAIEYDKTVSDSLKLSKRDLIVTEYIDYVKSSLNPEDILDLCISIPELKGILSKLLEQKYNSRYQQQTTREAEYRRYSGTYDRIEDVPGYGTEWNHRCIPDGIVIRGGIFATGGSNRRC